MTVMICSRCTGEHHSMACPQLQDTLLAIGVRPDEPAEIRLHQPNPVRPFYAACGSKSLVTLVLDATY